MFQKITLKRKKSNDIFIARISEVWFKKEIKIKNKESINKNKNNWLKKFANLNIKNLDLLYD